MSTAQHITILTHLSPDGDAMGSSLAMYLWLRDMGKDSVHVIVPNEYPAFLAWMPNARQDIIFETQTDLAKQLMHEADLIICTDFCEPKRIGAAGDELVAVAQAGTPVLIIDHHLPNPTLSPLPNSLIISRPASPSASQIVYEFIRLMSGEDYPISQELGTCIYTGMMTDTGNFAFNSNNPEMYEIIADLLRAGVDKDSVYDHIFNTHTQERMRMVGYCLYQKMQILNGNTAIITLDKNELQQFRFRSGDAEGIVNMPLQIAEVKYSVFMREDKDKIKISMRSQGDRPVNTLCHDCFNGGGHMNASGGEFIGTIADAEAHFRAHFRQYFDK